MPRFLTIGYGDQAGYDQTPVALRDAAHEHDARLVAEGADVGTLRDPVRVTNTSTGKPAWRYLRVWEWVNPKQAAELESVEMISNGGPQSPILLALTGAQW